MRITALAKQGIVEKDGGEIGDEAEVIATHDTVKDKVGAITY